MFEYLKEMINPTIKLKLITAVYFILLAFIGTPTQTHGQTNEEKAVQAQKLLDESIKLNGAGTAESLQASLSKFEQAKHLYNELGDKKREFLCLSRIASIYQTLGERQKALEHYAQALQLSRVLRNKESESNILESIGNIFNAFGEHQKALEHHEQALQLRRSIADEVGETLSLNNIGNVYRFLGENQKALEYYERVLRLTSQNEDWRIKALEAAVLDNTGTIYNTLGEYQKALKYHTQALQVGRNFGNKSNEILSLGNIGRNYYALGEHQKALEYLAQALSSLRASGYSSGVGLTLSNIGKVYDALGDKAKALEYYSEALPLLRNFGYKKDEADTLSNLFYLFALGNRRYGIFYGKQAVNNYQTLRSHIKGLDKSVQKTFLKTIENTYRSLADILILEGRLAEAQQVLNSFKDQQFFDFDQSQRNKLLPLSLTPRETDFVSRYEKSNERIGVVTNQLGELKRKIDNRQSTAEENTHIQKLEKDVKTVSDEFFDVLKQAETEFSKPADEKDKIGDIPDTREMQTALRNLNQQIGQRTAVVYTLIGEDNFRALIVSPDGIKDVSYPIKGTELNNKALKLWSLLQSDKYDTTVLSKQIYDVVFAPIEKELPKDTTTIMWSLDGNLRYLPVAALWDGKRFLAERYNHVNFTRADGERLTRAVNPNWTGTGFGTSNAQTVELLGDKISFSALPGVTAELAEIFKQTDSKTGILAGEVLPDKQFTKTSFLTAMKRKRPLVHIASHFSFRPGDEARSFLLLGDGTALTLNEMKGETNLFQGVDLLTLSACNTAAAQADANGREIDGFAELAQRLGAGAVMATLWSVSDASTPWLMRDFYATRQSQAGMTKAEALRRAQIALLNGTAETKPLPNAEKGAENNKVQIIINPKGKRDGNGTRSDIVYLDEAEAPLYKKDGKKPFAHPYYWSPFILFGNWK